MNSINLPKFYRDRRKRGMTDQVIIKELQSVGWSKQEAENGIKSLRKKEEAFSSQGSVQYSPPALSQRGIFLSLVVFSIFLFLFGGIEIIMEEGIESFQTQLPMELIGYLVIALIAIIIGSKYLAQFIVNHQARLIMLDDNGITKQTDKMTTIPWSQFTSFKIIDWGAISNAFPIFLGFFMKSLKKNINPGINIHLIKKGTDSQNYVLRIPEQYFQQVYNYLKARLPEKEKLVPQTSIKQNSVVVKIFYFLITLVIIFIIVFTAITIF
ncbi:hypothetical protein ACFL0L_03195 [Patescibacteria group bacterium]